MNICGIAMGLAAAFFLAMSYVFSGMSVRRFATVGSFGILCRAHVLMGLLALAGLSVVYSPVAVTGFRSYWQILLSAVAFYLVGQTGLFMAQKTVDSSRVVPLLGLKLIMLALINMFLLPLLVAVNAEHYSLIQWVGIGLTLGSAFMLNQAGGRIPLKSLAWILLACLGYALSDTFIKLLITRVTQVAEASGDPLAGSQVKLSILCAMLTYVFAGVLGVLALPLCPVPREVSTRGLWKCVSPFAVCWLTAMLFLYTCFNMVGTVNGNIVQSTRGLMAILLGWFLSRWGFTELEARIGLAVFWRRFAAGVMMILAIVLFNW